MMGGQMLRHGFYSARFLSIVMSIFLVVFSVGSGTQSHVSTVARVAQSMPTAAAIPFDLDSPEGVAQAIANDPMAHATSQRFDAQTLDTPALVF
jgi:hypothetical protein